MAQWIEPWIGFDLDSTIANGNSVGYEIGPPIEKMINRIKHLRSEGKEVRIVTARCDGTARASSKEEAAGINQDEWNVLDAIRSIENWCRIHIGEVLPITDRKDCGMKYLFDDKAIRVNKNTGELCTGCYHYLQGVENSNGKRNLVEFAEVEEIGGGIISGVYKAIDVNSNRVVALKCLRDKWLTEETVVNQFHIECEAMTRVFHANIVKYHNRRFIQDRSYVVMDYIIDASNLEDEIKRGRKFSVGETKDTLFPIAQALDYCHQQGVFHCDVKPRNILLKRKSIPILTDFGIAQLSDKETFFSIGNIWGTVLNYMAPEVLRGERATSRSDQFSLAVTAFDMMTGIVSKDSKLTNALSENPLDRFSSCKEFIRSLK